MKNKIPWFGATDIGRRRKSNQDCFAAFPELGLWVLCDGMGGHAGGAEAAAKAVIVIEAEIRDGRNLLEAVELAHLAVIQLGNDLLCEDKTSRRPGTTVVALRADFERYEIVWVGDSRAWTWNAKTFTCLTTDHTVVQDLVNWGDLTQAEALQHPQRHQLTQALGVDGRGKLQPGRVSGSWNPQKEVIILTSDGAFCHELPDLTAHLLATVCEPEEIVTKMISESLRRGGEDNVTVVAVGKVGEKSGFRLKSGGFFRKFRNRFGLNKIIFPVVFTFLLVFMSLFSALPVQATMPGNDKLDCVCREAAARLAEGYGVAALDRVAVYFLCPRGCSLYNLNPEMKREAKVVTVALQDALTMRDEFKVLNRENEVWDLVLRELVNRGTLDEKTKYNILKGAAGLGARWIVTGEYWETDNGLFHMSIRLFHGGVGESVKAVIVDSSFVSLQQRRLGPLFLGLAALLLVLCGGGALLLLTKKRKLRSQKLKESRVSSENQDQLAQAVARRDPNCLDRLDDIALATLPSALQKIALALKQEVGALCLDGNSGRHFIIASGSEQGLGRGEKWLFSFSDPRISRAPQAFLKIDGGRSFIVHNRAVGNPTLVNGEEFAARPLAVGDEIVLSSATKLKVNSLLADGGALLDVIEGPDFGRSLVLFNRELPFAGLLPGGTSREAKAQLSTISIIWQKERYLLVIGETAEKSKMIVRNERFTDDLRPEPGTYLVLCDGDQLCDASGRSLFVVGLPVTA